MQKLRDFFASTETPRWWLLAGGVALVLATFGQNEYYHRKNIQLQQVAEERQRVEARIVEIERQSIEFQTYAGAFVSAVLDQSRDIDSHRQRLVESIVAQDAAVDVSARLFDADTRQAVAEYRAALQQMNHALQSADDVLTLSAFWEAASDLLVARNSLLEQLARQGNNWGS